MRAYTTLLARSSVLALAVAIAASLLAWPASAQERGARKPKRRAPTATPAETQPEPAPSNEAAASDPAQPAGEGGTSGAASGEQAPGATNGVAESQDARANTEPQAPSSAELSATRTELSSVMDALVSARTRVGLLGKSLFKTKVRVTMDNEALSDQALGAVTLWLDGALIYRGEGNSLREEGAELFQGFAAPGPHVLTVEVEQRARENDEYRYTMKNGFRFFVLREHVTLLKIVLDDDSDVAEDFPDDKEGEYDVQMRLEIEARPLGGS
jgi:hypothetical protein